MSTDLIAFIRARLDEREQTARQLSETSPGPWWLDSREAVDAVLRDANGEWVNDVWTRDVINLPYLVQNDPAYVLADIESKRKIIDRYLAFVHLRQNQYTGPPEVIQGIRAQLLSILKEMAEVYSDHPDYQPTWRPQ